MRKELVADICRSANSWAVYVERHTLFDESVKALQVKYDHLYQFKTKEEAAKFAVSYSANNKFIVSNDGTFEEAA